MRELGIPTSVNDFRLRNFQNLHYGKRCFIVGSGPSMKLEYLEKLKEEFTFSANQIFKVFSLTSWRPSFYVIADTIIAQHHKDTILNLPIPVKFVSSHMRSDLNGRKSIIYFPKTHENYIDQPPPFSPNCLSKVEGGYTVSYLAMQLAWFMGFREIYVLGIDARYDTKVVKPIESHGSYELVKANTSGSYFLPDMISESETTFLPLPERQILAYISAKDFIESNGGIIANVAADSPLPTFQRINFESLF